MTGYLPGDPRYGLSGEALRNYYRTKPAQWAIYCWDKPGTEATRRALLQNQKSYVKHFGECVVGYGHFVSDDGRDTLGTSFFMQLDDRAAADAFVAGEPMNKAGVYQRVEIHRWSNSFQKRQAARAGIEGLGHRHERDVVGVEQLDELGKIGKRAGQPVDLVDQHDVDLARANIGQELLQRRALERGAGESAIVVAGTDQPPALVRLTPDIGLTGLALGVERVEGKLKIVLARLARIDGAARELANGYVHGVESP
jgi:uncharacterized protein YciI